jgi:hypothetical protein
MVLTTISGMAGHAANSQSFCEIRDRPLTCDASTAEAAAPMQEHGIGRRLASNRSLREEQQMSKQATNREFK